MTTTSLIVTGRRRTGVQAPETRRRGAGDFLRRLPIRLIIVVLLIIEIYPMFWMFLGSFKTQSEFLNEPFWALPQSWALDNYVEVFTTGEFGTYIINSVVTVFPALLIILAFGTAAGFALEVMVWRGRGTVLLLFLAGIMVPAQMILLPLFSIYFRTHLTGTLWPLIITYVAIGMPLTVFMMATFFRAVPREIFEASTLDGASIFRSFWSVGVPLVKNALFTVGLVQFFFLWNDLLIALTFTTSSDLRTIQVGLLNFTGEYGAVQYGPTFAAIAVNVFGTLLIYLFLNQQVMKGLTAGSVKG
ncbi:carbohydrate ABC transporter permease [Microbacterium terricola]|uniref:ABC transporter permease n=1 Tax=Microbacterium terricola TaxID=344163 RepID=A0ABM8E1R1_9MICO|nr:carbohydrate ABC transporter permease [Microbacterium terricola]UYK40409.1 carbohydrate ABC transporter permease [Microbacterium terricola]BDV31873.1 ABC transporter permease [Microbacterium terricola]